MTPVGVRTSFTHYAVPRPGSWICVFEYHFSFQHIVYFFSLRNIHCYVKTAMLFLQMKWNYLHIDFCALSFICGSQCFTYTGGIIVHVYICRNWNKNEIAAAKSNKKRKIWIAVLLPKPHHRKVCVLWLLCLWGSLMVVGKCRQLYANTHLLQLRLFSFKNLLIFLVKKENWTWFMIQIFVLRLRWCGLWHLVSIIPTMEGSFCQIVHGLLIDFFNEDCRS